MCDECGAVGPMRGVWVSGVFNAHCLTGPAYGSGRKRYWVMGEGGFDTPEEHAEAVIRYLLKKGQAHV